MGPMPGRPARRLSANSAVLRPRAQITPMPVTATRRMLRRAGSAFSLSRYQLLHSHYHLAHVAHVANLIVGDGNVELVFKRKEDFHRVHGIDAEFLELAVDGDFLDRDLLATGNCLEYAL